MAVAKDRDYLEGLCTAHRIFELRHDPVVGHFDAAHLREINRRIFQDLPDLGFADVTPGEYRQAVPAGKDWYKARTLEGRDLTLFVAYSSMDRKALQEIDQALTRIDTSALGKLDVPDFTKTIANLYVRLDYLHPFSDGNSRTLRAFTTQLAKAAGYEIDWARFSRSRAGRNVLYVARDLSVNRLALPHIESHETRRQVVLTLDRFGGNRDLPDLLRDVVRPLSQIA
jgi:cell filamentation protein